MSNLDLTSVRNSVYYQIQNAVLNDIDRIYRFISIEMEM